MEKFSGLVLDIYDDPSGDVLRGVFPDYDDLPEMVKSAHALSAGERDGLPDDAFALVIEQDGMELKKFATVDPGNTALSVEYFLKTGGKLPEGAQKVAAHNLCCACGWFGIEPPEALQKVAAGEKLAMTSFEAQQELRPYFESAVQDLADSGNVSRSALVRAGVDRANEDVVESRKILKDIQANPMKYRVTRGIGGAVGGGLIGSVMGGALGGPKAALIAGGLSAAVGAGMGAIPKPTGDSFKRSIKDTQIALRKLSPREKSDFAGRVLANRLQHGSDAPWTPTEQLQINVKTGSQKATVSRAPKVRERQLEALRSRGFEGTAKTADAMSRAIGRGAVGAEEAMLRASGYSAAEAAQSKGLYRSSPRTSALTPVKGGINRPGNMPNTLTEQLKKEHLRAMRRGMNTPPPPVRSPAMETARGNAAARKMRAAQAAARPTPAAATPAAATPAAAAPAKPVASPVTPASTASTTPRPAAKPTPKPAAGGFPKITGGRLAVAAGLGAVGLGAYKMSRPKMPRKTAMAKEAIGALTLGVGALVAPGAISESKKNLKARQGMGGAVVTPAQLKLRRQQMGLV